MLVDSYIRRLHWETRERVIHDLTVRAEIRQRGKSAPQQPTGKRKARMASMGDFISGMM